MEAHCERTGGRSYHRSQHMYVESQVQAGKVTGGRYSYLGLTVWSAWVRITVLDVT